MFAWENVSRLDEMFSSPADGDNKEPRCVGPTENNSPAVNGDYKIFAYRTETLSFSHNFVFFTVPDTTRPTYFREITANRTKFSEENQYGFLSLRIKQTFFFFYT